VIEAPDGNTSSTLPGVPAAFSADDPTATSATLAGATVEYVDFSNIANFTIVRANASAVALFTQAFSTIDHTVHATIASSP
jgi:hypothetical protein